MKYVIHRSESRGHVDHGWLKAAHSFSFASYFNPEKMGFGALRVLNDDIIAPGHGFGLHPHENMEIVTIVLEGKLLHKDDMGNKEYLKPGEVQVMSAGTGIIHSEYNGSSNEQCKLLQIWVLPREHSVKPRYMQKAFDKEDKLNKILQVVSSSRSEEDLWINQDAQFSLCLLEKGKSVDYNFNMDGKRGVYLLVIDGEIGFEKETLRKRDALAIQEVSKLSLTAHSKSNFLIIEVPMA
jgi:redox-sensitive bicupin YhaK (pirin superfamily)